MSECNDVEPNGRAVRIAVSVSAALLVGGLLCCVCWWTGWWTLGFGWLSAKLTAKAAVAAPLVLFALIAWRGRRRRR